MFKYEADILTQVASGDCPHTLFYGPPGAGKKTLILALLREIYGVGAERVSACITYSGVLSWVATKPM